MKTRTMYMHTWHGQAAVWLENEQRIRVLFPGDRVVLAKSHAAIRQQWKRDKELHGERDADGYGYVLVEVPCV